MLISLYLGFLLFAAMGAALLWQPQYLTRADETRTLHARSRATKCAPSTAASAWRWRWRCSSRSSTRRLRARHHVDDRLGADRHGGGPRLFRMARAPDERIIWGLLRRAKPCSASCCSFRSDVRLAVTFKHLTYEVRRPDRDHHAEPAGTAERHHARHAAGNPRGGREGERRQRDPRHRPHRRRPLVLRRLRSRRLRRTPEPRGSRPRRHVRPMGPDGRLRDDEPQHAGLHVACGARTNPRLQRFAATPSPAAATSRCAAIWS